MGGELIRGSARLRRTCLSSLGLSCWLCGLLSDRGRRDGRGPSFWCGLGPVSLNHKRLWSSGRTTGKNEEMGIMSVG